MSAAPPDSGTGCSMRLGESQGLPLRCMQALAISCPDWMAEMLAPGGRAPHITVSTAPGVRARDSSDLVKAALKGNRRVSYLKVPEEPRRAARALCLHETVHGSHSPCRHLPDTHQALCCEPLPALTGNTRSSARPVSLAFDLA